MITVYNSIIEYLNAWNLSLSVSDRTKGIQARYINKLIAPCLGTIQLNQYNEGHLYQLRRYLFDNPDMTEGVAFAVLRTFRRAMKHAQEISLIRDSFCDSLYLPLLENRAIRVYTPEEISAIFDILEYEELGNFFKLIYYAGLLRSEARGIRISDIDIPNRTLHIRRRLYGNCLSNQYTTALENRQHIRDIYLSDSAMAAILDELKRRKEKKAKPYCRNDGEGALFINRSGNPITQSIILNTMHIIQEISGISDFSTLSLRYSAADAALKAGASEKDIQDFLGCLQLSTIYRMKSKFYCEGENYDNQYRRRINPIYL